MLTAFYVLFAVHISNVALVNSVQRKSMGRLIARIDWRYGISHFQGNSSDANEASANAVGNRRAVAKHSRAHDWETKQRNRLGQIDSTKEIENAYFAPVMYGACIGITLCVGIYALFRPSTVESPAAEAEARCTTPLTLNILRHSGEALTTVNAEYFWSGKQLREAVSAELPPNEFLHSISYLAGACPRRVMDFACIGELGLKEGSELTVVLLSCLAIPSGVALFCHEKKIVGPMGARNSAKLWVHEDRSAHLECGEFIDVGISNVKYLNGKCDSNGRVHLVDDSQDFEGTIEELQGQQRVTSLCLPILGDVEMKQEIVDAVFDVSQIANCSGWISLFECAEIIAKLEKKLPENTTSEAANLRFQVWRQRIADGALKITFQNMYNFESWQARENTEVRCRVPCATLSGIVGRRKLVLEDFPIIGRVELLEHPLCRDMLDP